MQVPYFETFLIMLIVNKYTKSKLNKNKYIKLEHYSFLS